MILSRKVFALGFAQALSLLAGITLFGAASANILSAQAQPAGCATVKHNVVCDKPAFLRAFAGAKTVLISTPPQDRAAAGQLIKAVLDLGKAVQHPGTPADLTLLLSRSSTDGVLIGPGGVELATLRVYASGGASGRETLIWLETLNGQPDMPWPAIVNALLRQFQDGLARP